MRKFFLSFAKSAPFAKLTALQKQADAHTQPQTTFWQYDAKLKTAIDVARASWEGAPTESNLEKLHLALEKRESLGKTDIWEVAQKRAVYMASSVRRSADAIVIYVECLALIKSGLETELSDARGKLRKAFQDAGDENANVDETPTVKRLLFQIGDLEAGLARLANNVPINDQDVMRITALCGGNLSSPPAPVPAPLTPAQRHREQILSPKPAPEPPQPDRHSILPASMCGLRPTPGTSLAPADARPLGGGSI